MSVGHSRRTSRKPSPQRSGESASSSWSSRSTPSFSSAAASPMSWVTSESTSSTRISSLSSVAPARLRTTISPGSSSITGGRRHPVLGSSPKDPPSCQIETPPSALSMSRRTAFGQVGGRADRCSRRSSGRRSGARREASFHCGRSRVGRLASPTPCCPRAARADSWSGKERQRTTLRCANGEHQPVRRRLGDDAAVPAPLALIANRTRPPRLQSRPRPALRTRGPPTPAATAASRCEHPCGPGRRPRIVHRFAEWTGLCVPLDIGGIEREHRLVLPVREHLQQSPHQLNVLLRHRAQYPLPEKGRTIREWTAPSAAGHGLAGLPWRRGHSRHPERGWLTPS